VSRTRPAGTLQPSEPPTGVLDLMGLDFIGPLPSSVAGNKYILVCTDYLSRWAVTQATSNCTAETAAKFLVEKIILQYASRCGVIHIKTTTYHPQTNGLTERFNATLAGSIGTYADETA
ncbi:unnamed protein product, partial [Didymodactylos carnosus]